MGGRRQTAPYSPAADSNHILIEPWLRRRPTSAWMRFCPSFGDRRRWHHSVALDGSITLHRVAELIAFSTTSRRTQTIRQMPCSLRDQAGTPLRAVEMAFPMWQAEAPVEREDHVCRAAQTYAGVPPSIQTRSVFQVADPAVRSASR
jgi:hypothetical protein